MLHFTVGGFIIGPKLPLGSMNIGGAEVRRRLPDQDFPRGRPRSPRMTAVDEDDQPVEQFQVSPGDLTVLSSWIIRFRVEADDHEGAMEEVEQRLLPPVVAVLEALGGEPYRVELVRIVDESPNGTSQSPWTDWAFGGTPDITPMTEEEQEAVVDMARMAQDDAVARETAELLQQSLQLHDFAAGHARLLRAAVLAVFQVIERIAQEVSKRAPGEVDDERQRTVIDHLARALDKPRAVAANTSSIRKAAAKLYEITGSTSDAQIVRAGGVLGLDDEVLRVARELRRFRNHRLGHPGQRVDARELEAWLKPGTGRGAAVHFWNRYLVWIAAGRPNSGVPAATEGQVQ